MTSHSPLGFSGAERYFNCPGSPALIAALPPDAIPPDPEYTKVGVAAHEAWAKCLREGLDAWEVAGPWAIQDEKYAGQEYLFTAEDLEAGQFYLDTVRDVMASAAVPIVPYVELVEWYHHAPAIHDLAFGTIDHAFIIEDHHAEVTDYKHGEGQFVEVEHNKQLKGYAALMLDAYPNLQHFKLRIVQPRFAGEQKGREWEISADDLKQWVDEELRPVMNRAGEFLTKPNDRHAVPLKAGPWCRFCPVQKALACPEHKQIAKVAEQVAPLVERMSDEQLDELTPKIQVLRMMIKSAENELLRRALAGVKFKHTKVVTKGGRAAWRVWKDGAAEALMAALPDESLFKTELKGPAEVEKLSKIAKKITAEYAYSPDPGYTVAPVSDRRKAIDIVPVSADEFDNYLDKPEEL